MHDSPKRTDGDANTASDGRRAVTRRRYLEAAGSTAALAAAGATPAAGESYTTITVPANSKETITVYGGETYENVLIDMTADGASAQITTRGSNWTIRDVGFKGVHPGGHYLLTPGVESSSGTGLIENVYLGDGQVAGTGSGGIWINANLPHRGTITFRNVHVAGMVDNGLYGSGPGWQGYCGNHHVEESYFYNNTISNNRTNARCRRCDVYDTVVHVDGDNPECWDTCSDPGSTHTRGFWTWYGETYLENVDVKVVGGTTFATAEGGYFTKNNVRSGSEADTTPPACVPSTAEDAADGSDCTGGGGGGGGGFDEVAEDFSHNDIPGTYSLDTGAFATSSTRSTTDSYSIRPDDAADDGNVIVRDDMGTTAGNTYELDVYHQSSSGADMGFVFGTQSATSWSDYTGYLALFESDADEIRVDRWEGGSQVSASATAMTWPLDEWLTVELDYRDTDSSTITMTVFDAAGTELGSVSLADTTYDSGTVGWYNYHATSDWFADSWFDAAYRDASQVAEDFSHNDVPGTYSLDTGAFTTSSTRSTSDSYSLQVDDSSDGGTLIVREDMITSAGNTYELDVYHQSSSGADMGFVFGTQSATSWSDFTGYFGFFESDADEIRVDYWEGGSQVASAATATTWPLDEWLTVELDYRDTDSSVITMTVFDAAGSEVGSVSLNHTTHDTGTVGWYNYHATSDWFADSWFGASDGGSATVLDDFEDGDISEYSGATSGYQVQSSTALEGSYTLEATSTYAKVAHADATTPRGYEYRCQIEAASGSGAEPSLLASVQDPSSPLQDCYWAFPDASAGAFKLVRRDGGSSTLLDSVAYTLQEATTYEVALELGSDTVKAVLYDSAGNVAAETTTVTDSTYSGGTFGFYTGGGTPGYYDYVTQTSL